ncbi:class I SAM-dependent DNA methyltransferase [Bacillus sp. 2205SS5-2]|uniref:class I SAM-dependent DNA methyltransferase n=1 Tax=Bacillus sp. 2205SS5-2 TaxID=3109031 RepID=UPI00300525DF
MEFKGSNAYEKEDFFNQYLQRRHRSESPNRLIENPAIFELLEGVSAETMLDLGCGDGSLGVELLQNERTQSYIGIDGSEKMLDVARKKLANLRGTVVNVSMEDYEYPEKTYDLVTSQLAIQYIEDFATLAKRVHETLKKSGKFVFSVQHPVITSSFESIQSTGKRGSWLVDDYFQTGERIEPWIGESVVKYHRTIEQYFMLLQEAGFTIEALKEGAPKKDLFEDEQEYERRKRIPLFLLFSCAK